MAAGGAEIGKNQKAELLRVSDIDFAGLLPVEHRTDIIISASSQLRNRQRRVEPLPSEIRHYVVQTAAVGSPVKAKDAEGAMTSMFVGTSPCALLGGRRRAAAPRCSSDLGRTSRHCSAAPAFIRRRGLFHFIALATLSNRQRVDFTYSRRPGEFLYLLTSASAVMKARAWMVCVVL